jgi:glycosyltransferase involved in cell wall biosynthesis
LQKIVVSVSNDLNTDQRVHKICTTLLEEGFEVCLIGRKLKSSSKLSRAYQTHRMRLFFNQGFLFYAEYNLRLFFRLSFVKKDILIANDLDTLLPNFLISKLSKKKLVYDSHELFTEVPELANRPLAQKTWLLIEQSIFPKLKNVYTVNAIIANIYSKKYKVPVKVVRNIAPLLKGSELDDAFVKRTKGGRKMLILQGAGINVDRGGEEAVEMMDYLPNFVLYIIGSGDVFPILKKKVAELKLEKRVFLLGRKPYEELMRYTKIADLGLSLDKNTNLNYEYSLPNKIFDYIQAKTPMLVSNRKIIADLVQNNDIGLVCKHHDPKKLADTVVEIFRDQTRYRNWKTNIEKAAKTYNWENEQKKLKEIYRNLL